MKNILSLLIMISLVVACEPQSKTIIGRWKLSKVSLPVGLPWDAPVMLDLSKPGLEKELFDNMYRSQVSVMDSALPDSTELDKRARLLIGWLNSIELTLLPDSTVGMKDSYTKQQGKWATKGDTISLKLPAEVEWNVLRFEKDTLVMSRRPDTFRHNKNLPVANEMTLTRVRE